MHRHLLAAGVALSLLTGTAFAQDGGSVFTNAPNELPSFFQHKTSTRLQAEATAGWFGHDHARNELRNRDVANLVSPRSVVN